MKLYIANLLLVAGTLYFAGLAASAPAFAQETGKDQESGGEVTIDPAKKKPIEELGPLVDDPFDKNSKRKIARRLRDLVREHSESTNADFIRSKDEIERYEIPAEETNGYRNLKERKEKVAEQRDNHEFEFDFQLKRAGENAKSLKQAMDGAVTPEGKTDRKKKSEIVKRALDGDFGPIGEEDRARLDRALHSYGWGLRLHKIENDLKEAMEVLEADGARFRRDNRMGDQSDEGSTEQARAATETAGGLAGTWHGSDERTYEITVLSDDEVSVRVTGPERPPDVEVKTSPMSIHFIGAEIQEGLDYRGTFDASGFQVVAQLASARNFHPKFDKTIVAKVLARNSDFSSRMHVRVNSNGTLQITRELTGIAWTGKGANFKLLEATETSSTITAILARDGDTVGGLTSD